MQKLIAKLSKEVLHGISEIWGPEATASFTSSNIHPCSGAYILVGVDSSVQRSVSFAQISLNVG